MDQMEAKMKAVSFVTGGSPLLLLLFILLELSIAREVPVHAPVVVGVSVEVIMSAMDH
jgi:hypothetical protein